MTNEKRDPRVDDALEAIEKRPDTVVLTHAKILAAEVRRLSLALEITKEAGRKLQVRAEAAEAHVATWRDAWRDHENEKTRSSVTWFRLVRLHSEGSSS
jgi:hypothetical protein